MLRIENLQASYGNHVVLRGVDLNVGAGEVVGLLGASGAGKSTLLRAVVGLQALDAGRVLLDDVDVAPLPVHRRGIGLMLQEGMLFPHLDVAANVGYGLRVQGLNREAIDARVQQVLALVDLAGLGARRIETLSGGQQQRVALARSLAPAPRLLLLDEPFGALDLVLRSQLVADVQRVVRELGISVLAVSHDRNEAFTWCDRVAVMESGRLVQTASPATLMEHPASPMVAGLMGMRIVDGEVFGESGTRWAIRPWASSIERLADATGGVGHRAAGIVVGLVPVGDRVRVSVVLDTDAHDVVVDAEMAWQDAVAVGDPVVAVIPETAVTRFAVESHAEQPSAAAARPS